MGRYIASSGGNGKVITNGSILVLKCVKNTETVGILVYKGIANTNNFIHGYIDFHVNCRYTYQREYHSQESINLINLV